MKQSIEATIEQALKTIPTAAKAAFVASYFNGLIGDSAAEPVRAQAPKAPAKKTGRKRGRVVVSGADAQAKVLAVLTGNSGDKFQMSQIAKTSGLKITTTQNALRVLVGEGKIFSSGIKGATRYSATKAGLKAETKAKPAKKSAKKATKNATKRVNARLANGVAQA